MYVSYYLKTIILHPVIMTKTNEIADMHTWTTIMLELHAKFKTWIWTQMMAEILSLWPWLLHWKSFVCVAFGCLGNTTSVISGLGWLACLEDLHWFTNISVISQLGSRRYSIYEIIVARLMLFVVIDFRCKRPHMRFKHSTQVVKKNWERHKFHNKSKSLLF